MLQVELLARVGTPLSGVILVESSYVNDSHGKCTISYILK